MIKAIIFDITDVLFPYQPWAGERPKREELLQIKKLITGVYDKRKMSKKYLKEKIFNLNRPREERDAIYNSLAVIDENQYELIKNLSVVPPMSRSSPYVQCRGKVAILALKKS